MKIYSNKNQNLEITSINDWLSYCPPVDKDKHWCNKRSAKEMANFWLDINKQNDFLLFINQIFPFIDFRIAYPEFATKFDKYKSPRKNDLCIFAETNDKKILIAIEGKSDEPFGKNFMFEWIASILKKESNIKSNKLDRIIALYNRFNNNGEILKLRYQLIYWLAGAIDEAKRNNIEYVFLISQEFHSDITKDINIKTNFDDFILFIKIISENQYSLINTNEIIGPIENKYTNGIKIYFGRYIENLK